MRIKSWIFRWEVLNSGVILAYNAASHVLVMSGTSVPGASGSGKQSVDVSPLSDPSVDDGT